MEGKKEANNLVDLTEMKGIKREANSLLHLQRQSVLHVQKSA